MNDAYVLTFPAAILIVGTLGWFFFRRWVKQSDDEAERKAQAHAREHEKLEAALSRRAEDVRQIELKMTEKVGYDKLEALRLEIKSDFEHFQSAVLAALGGRRHGDGSLGGGNG